jgi:hypothetical protein
MSFLINPYVYGGDRLVLELLGNGTNGSTTFLDTSAYQRTVTRFGTAQISTAQSVEGGSSILLDGNSDNLELAADSSLYIQAGEDFTIEAWVYMTSITGNRTLFSVLKNNASGWNSELHFVFRAVDTAESNLPTIAYYTAGDLTIVVARGSSTVALNAWTHLAAVRNNGSIVVYVDGIGGTPVSDNSKANVPGNPVVAHLGKFFDFNFQEWFPGYIDSFRFYKTAIYTGNFTP